MGFLFSFPIFFLFAFLIERSHYVFFYQRSILLECLFYAGLISGAISLVMALTRGTLNIKSSFAAVLAALVFVFILPLRFDISYMFAIICAVVNIFSVLGYVKVIKK